MLGRADTTQDFIGKFVAKGKFLAIEPSKIHPVFDLRSHLPFQFYCLKGLQTENIPHFFFQKC